MNSDGFSEKVYQRAFAIALRESGFKVDEQVAIKVYYHGQVVGEFFADMVVNDVILLELKAVDSIFDEHEAQLLNYLKATEKALCVGRENKKEYPCLPVKSV